MAEKGMERIKEQLAIKPGEIDEQKFLLEEELDNTDWNIDNTERHKEIYIGIGQLKRLKTRIENTEQVVRYTEDGGIPIIPEEDNYKMMSL